MTGPLLNDALAAVILRELKAHPKKCIRVSGRIGGQPHVRYRDGDWEYATWAGAGQRMTGTKSQVEVQELLQSGPRIELLNVADLEVWED